jgi:hypothetical protein
MLFRIAIMSRSRAGPSPGTLVEACPGLATALDERPVADCFYPAVKVALFASEVLDRAGR